MIVAATYSDGTVRAITNYTYPTAGLTKGTSVIPVSYVEDGKTFVANVPILVTAECYAISVTTPPDKTTYEPGEYFDPTGMVVEATYEDGTVVQITGYTIENGTSLTKEQTSVTIKYEDKTNIHGFCFDSNGIANNGTESLDNCRGREKDSRQPWGLCRIGIPHPRWHGVNRALFGNRRTGIQDIQVPEGKCRILIYPSADRR
jgi:hypothetical protein